jgi:hypothetical protein
MIVPIHPDDDSEELTDCWHLVTTRTLWGVIIP